MLEIVVVLQNCNPNRRNDNMTSRKVKKNDANKYLILNKFHKMNKEKPALCVYAIPES